jgi:AcrR family transcriptional regulator
MILRNVVNDTKENILQAALRLFAQDGYEAVSVSEIAVELGITKGALYKHYKSKRDIFDSIVERVYQEDAAHSKKYKVPERIFDEAPQLYKNVDIENIKTFIEAQFRFWLEDEFSVNIRRMLSLERYRNLEMGNLYQKIFVSGPVSYIKDVFHEMMKEGTLAHDNPMQLAIEFCAPFYFLLSLSDEASSDDASSNELSNKNEMIHFFETHVENFMKHHFKQHKKMIWKNKS